MNRNEREILIYLKDTSHLFGAIDLCLGDYGYSVHFAWNIEKAMDSLSRNYIDLVITDLSMNSPEGLDLLARIQETSPLATVMVLRGNEEIDPPCNGPDGETDYYLITPGFRERHILLPDYGVGTSVLN